MPVGAKHLKLKLVQGETQPYPGMVQRDVRKQTPNATAVFSTAVGNTEILRLAVDSIERQVSKDQRTVKTGALGFQLKKKGKRGLKLLFHSGAECPQ